MKTIGWYHANLLQTYVGSCRKKTGITKDFRTLLPTEMLYHNHQKTLFSVNHRTAGYQSCFCGSCIAF